MATNLYGYADVGTMGLTHSLVAWARCRIWCDENNAQMLAPRWPRIRGRIGPRLRKEYDDRQYNRLFRFAGYTRGVYRAVLLRCLKRCNADFFECDAGARSSGDARLVVFQNLSSGNDQKYFPSLVGHGKRIADELIRVTRPEYRPKEIQEPHVAVHVRMGDFRELSHEELLRGQANGRLPVKWYVGIINTLRNDIGNFPVKLYSEGDDESLRPLLELNDVRRVPKQSSITDLLSIAQAKLVVSSSSGFGMWGAYLGNSPRISYPGQLLQRAFAVSDLDFEPECIDAKTLSPVFRSFLKERLGLT